MKILLLSMPDTVPQFTSKTWRAPNLAISSIAGNIENHDVFLADLVLKRDTLKDAVLDLLKTHKPDVIGLSAMSFQFATAKKIAGLIKDVNKNFKTVIGGYHATLMYEEISKSDDGQSFDYIIRGEGDLCFGEMLDAIEGKRKHEDVSGLSFKSASGGFVHNPPRPLENLENIKLPDRTKRLWSGYLFSGSQLDMVETSRGCTMMCNFCSMQRMYGRTFRTYSIERIIADIANARKHGATYMAFSDDNITLNVKRFEKVCEAIAEAGHNDIGYIVQASTTGIASSPTLAEKMARAGIKVVFLGIENVSERNLKLMNKGSVVEKAIKAVEYLHKNNILIVGGMILGHPDDKEEDIAQNFEFFNKLNIDFYGDQIITPYPKTESRENLLKAGLVTNADDFKKYNGFWANVKTNNLSSDELQFLRWKYRRIYSTFFKTTPVFKRNFPLINLLRVLILRPYYLIKNFITSIGKTERQIFEQEMARITRTNEFF